MCNTAKEIWKTLLITHQGNSQVKDNKIDLLVQQYEQFVISEDESIDSAFARFNTIITSLKALDEGYSSKNYVRKFLRALHPKWRAKVTAIEESKDLTSLSLDELIRNLKNSKGDRKCFRCGDPNHLIGECPKPPKDKNQRDFVGGSWNDSGEEYDEKVKDETCLVAHTSSEICLGVDLEPDEWIKDSGCSKHMTGNRKLFSTYKAYNGGNIIFGSNLRGNIIGKGMISNDSLKIDNVEHVDNLGFNLLSIGQICDNKCRVTFSEHDSEITKDGKVIGRGIRKKSLYVMKLGNKPKDQSCLTTIDEDFTLWHRRLGHANMRLIQSLTSKEFVRNLPKLKFDQPFCNACKIGKQAMSNRIMSIVTSTLVDDDLDEEEAIKVTKKKNLENDIVDETLEVDEIINIKESRNHPLENLANNLPDRLDIFEGNLVYQFEHEACVIIRAPAGMRHHHLQLMYPEIKQLADKAGGRMMAFVIRPGIW
ncbi:retrovirus-related pol polyprotein from transposon TNT 1-94 [Tanacetum coccineum]